MWLILDIGTTGTKAALFDEALVQVESAYRDYPTQHPGPNRVVQSPLDWWAAAQGAIGDLTRRADVTAIALTGQMQELILLSATGEPVRPAILYSDTRATAQAEAFVTATDIDALRRQTGNKQAEGPDGLPAKLMWLAEHEPESFSVTEHVLFGAADYIAFKLTGARVSDTTTTSTTGLMNWQARTVLDLDPVQPLAANMPKIVFGGTVAGTLLSEVADTLGLPAGVSVHIGPGDAGAASIGSGSGEPGVAYGYLGTSGWVAFTSTEKAAFDSGVITIAHPNPAYAIQIAPLLTAGGNLEWVRDLFGYDDYDALVDEAITAHPEPVNLLFLPYLNGERSPFVDPSARGAFLGLSASSTQAEMTRAVLTGVAFGYRHALDELMPEPPESLVVAGMGAQSGPWMQIFADVLGITVRVAADAENAGLRGAIVAAQVANGNRKDYALLIEAATTYTPNPNHRAHYDRLFAAFKAAYIALRPIFPRVIGAV